MEERLEIHQRAWLERISEHAKDESRSPEERLAYIAGCAQGALGHVVLDEPCQCGCEENSMMRGNNGFKD